MGRTVLADESINAYIKDLTQKTQWYVGLIIGQLASQKDFVLKIARTPDPSEDEVCEESLSSIGEASSEKKRSTYIHPRSLATADEYWVASHAKQIIRMLPGGLDVIGIFAVAPAPMLKDAQLKLRQLVIVIHKTVLKHNPFFPSDGIPERIILQVDSLTSKINCSSLDVYNPKSTPRPAEWKYQSSPIRWLQLDTAVSVDVSFPVPYDQKQQLLLKNLQRAIAPFCKEIWKSIVTIDGAIQDPQDPLAQISDKKKGKGKEKDMSLPLKDTFDVDIFIPQRGGDDIQEPFINHVGELIYIRGIIVCRAFVNWRASVKEGIEAIKSDVVRSLCARCELLCEDIDLVDEDRNSRLFDTPVRVFSHAPSAGAQLCDYMFQDEKLKEVSDRITDLFDVQVNVDSLEKDCERPARDNDWVAASASEYNLNTLQEDASRFKKKNLSYILRLVVSGTVAAAAAVLTFFYLGDV